MNAIVENAGTTPEVTVAEKAPRDKCKRALALYNRELPSLEAEGARAFRSRVLQLLAAELPCTPAAAVAHFNNARIANGGTRRVLGPRKNKSSDAAPNAGDSGVSPSHKSDEVWVVERVDGSKSWHVGEEAAREVAATLGDKVHSVARDLEVEAEG